MRVDVISENRGVPVLGNTLGRYWDLPLLRSVQQLNHSEVSLSPYTHEEKIHHDVAAPTSPNKHVGTRRVGSIRI
jgi:hypothetical protein